MLGGAAAGADGCWEAAAGRGTAIGEREDAPLLVQSTKNVLFFIDHFDSKSLFWKIKNVNIRNSNV